MPGFGSSGLLHPRFHENVQGSAVGDAGLPDQCTIARAGDGGVDDDGIYHPPANSIIYAGDCRIQPEATQARVVVIGDEAVTLHRYRASIRSDGAQVLVDDVLTVTTSSDPQLAGRPFIVRDVHYDTFAVRRYLLLEDHPDQPTPEM